MDRWVAQQNIARFVRRLRDALSSDERELIEDLLTTERKILDGIERSERAASTSEK